MHNKDFHNATADRRHAQRARSWSSKANAACLLGRSTRWILHQSPRHLWKATAGRVPIQWLGIQYKSFLCDTSHNYKRIKINGRRKHLKWTFHCSQYHQHYIWYEVGPSRFAWSHLWGKLPWLWQNKNTCKRVFVFALYASRLRMLLLVLVRRCILTDLSLASGCQPIPHLHSCAT